MVLGAAVPVQAVATRSPRIRFNRARNSVNRRSKQLRDAAIIAQRAGLPNVAKTCKRAAAEIDRLAGLLQSVPMLTGEDARRLDAAMEEDAGIAPELHVRAVQTFDEIGLPRHVPEGGK
jgi:hypothetical protein